MRAFRRTSHHESFGWPEVRHWREERVRLEGVVSSSLRSTLKELYLRVRCSVWPGGMLRHARMGPAQVVYDLADVWYRTHRW